MTQNIPSRKATNWFRSNLLSGVRLGNCMKKYEKSLFFTWHLTEGDFAALL